jgi:hypothetical protein
MVTAARGTQPGYYVLTYHSRVGQAKEPEVIAHGQVKNPASEDGAVEGDAVKAILDMVQNHQCHGEASAGGCARLHANAENRVISRLAEDHGEPQVVSTWRRYHPRVAQGVAIPGRPFVATDGEDCVRVEVRRIVPRDSAELTDKTISLFSIRQLEADLSRKANERRLEQSLRDALATFEANYVANVNNQIDNSEDQFRYLPGADARAVSFTRARAEVESIRAEFSRQVEAEVAAFDPNTAGQALGRLNQSMNTLWNRLARIQQSIQISPAARQVLAQQTPVRNELNRLQGFIASFEGAQRELPFLARPEGADKIRERLIALLERSRNGAGAGELQLGLAQISPEIDRLAKQIGQAIWDGQSAAASFRERVRFVEDLRTGSPAEQDVLRFIQSGKVIAGFAVAHYTEEATKLIASLPEERADVSQLAPGREGDERELAEAERALAPFHRFMEGVEGEMKERAAALGLYQPLQIGPHSVVAPTAKVELLRLSEADGMADLRVTIRNNDPRPILLELKSELAGANPRRLTLGGKGRTATIELRNVQNNLVLALKGVWNGEPLTPYQQLMMARFSNLDATTPPVTLEAAGRSFTLAPYMFTPSANQPAGLTNAYVENQEAGVGFGYEPVPGA